MIQPNVTIVKVLFAFHIVLLLYFGKKWYVNCGIIFFLSVLAFYWNKVWIFVNNFSRDVKFANAQRKHENFAKRIRKEKLMLYDKLIEFAQTCPNKPAYISAETGEQLTFKEANKLANKVANYFNKKGFSKGDVVALMMENRIEYLPIWLGLSKIGVATALVNTNAKYETLHHRLNIVNAKCLIHTSVFADIVKNIEMPNLEKKMWDGDSDSCISKDLESTSYCEPSDCVRGDNTVVFMYTSGTTGLPKAVLMNGYRCMFISSFFPIYLGIKSTDICYNTLPLCHSNGGLVAAGSCLFAGATVVIRKKFSASNFFKECCRYECTFFSFIGELCRYLLAQPKQEHDQTHHLKFALGNGLKTAIWKDFQDRFNIHRMNNFYGCTEGNFAFLNMFGHIGSIGFYPSWCNRIFGLVKIDESKGCIIRGPDGLGIPSKPGEPGMFVTIIEDELMPFDGYTDKNASEKKIEHNVLSKGEKVIVYGDMLYADENGYYYFLDRLGDSFRWKGENVSTNEVEGIISKYLQQSDVCVYAVEIEGIEGKAGMACIADSTNKMDLKTFSSDIKSLLPSYARPMFIRLSNNVEMTSTFKMEKNKLRKEGFDPSKCGNDDLFYYDVDEETYCKLTDEVYERVQNNNIKF